MNDQYKPKFLILDDEQDMLRLLKRSLPSDLNAEVTTASNPFAALNLLESEQYDVLLADIRMPGMSGMELLSRMANDTSKPTIVMMTAYATIDLAVQAIKNGAYDFITKPFEHEKLVHVLEKALERSRLVRENLILQKRIRDQESFHEMIGFSPNIQKVFDSIGLISKTDATVLITGESGTGKDLAARAIHGRSSRSSGPYVAVNCPNLPENILESELFGYKKGAFTHATQDKKGLFWEAQGGTIYLDEIGDISLSLQVKLLRVLQEKEIRPLGETKNIKVDVRIVASTNRDLQAKMRENLFREDLFYRLNVLTLQMPALRERREDIPLLANHFLKKFCSEYKLPEKSIHPSAMQRLMNSRWRGNVRELENVISRAVLMSPTDEIQATDFDSIDEAPSLECSGISFNNLNYKDAKNQLLERFHHEYLSNLLIRNQGNVTKAAKECGLERQALQQVMKRYSIKAKELHHPEM